MIRELQRWDLANRIETKTFPHSIWKDNMCLLVDETKNNLVLQFRNYLDKAFGNDKWVIAQDSNTYKVSSKNGKFHFSDFTYRNRNEANS